jgi:hypothetical protein
MRFNRPNAGDPFEPDTAAYAYILDHVEADQPGARRPGNAAGLLPPGLVKIRNLAATDAARGHCLEMQPDAIETDLGKGPPVIGADIPTAGESARVSTRLAVCQQPIPAGKIGLAVCRGLAVALVDFTTAGVFRFGRPTADRTIVDDLAGPVQIIGRPYVDDLPTVDDGLLALVEIGPPVFPTIHARSLSALNPGAWGTMGDPADNFIPTTAAGRYYAPNDAGVYQPAWMDSAETLAANVALYNFNTESVGAAKQLTATLNDRGQFAINVESCRAA